jgi:hypothetical protein
MASRLQNASGKTIAAVVLIAFMVLLWGRVLLKGKNAPAAAEAQESQQIEQAAMQAGRPVKLLPVKLTVVKGRHDVLTGDMFSTGHWTAFDLGNGTASVSATESTLEQRHQANLEKIAAGLKLEAVIRDADGKPYQVFVNDEILTVGSVLTAKEGPDYYELVLKAISENEAMFIWNKTSITLKMTEMVEK